MISRIAGGGGARISTRSLCYPLFSMSIQPLSHCAHPGIKLVEWLGEHPDFTGADGTLFRGWWYGLSGLFVDA